MMNPNPSGSFIHGTSRGRTTVVRDVQCPPLNLQPRSAHNNNRKDHCEKEAKKRMAANLSDRGEVCCVKISTLIG